MIVIRVIVGEVHGDVKVRISLYGVVYACLYVCPVFAFLVQWQ